MKATVKRACRLHLWEILLLVGTMLFLSSGVFALQTQQELAEKVVRLHVLANSDSEEDQALKLQVRDAVLAHLKELDDRKFSVLCCDWANRRGEPPMPIFIWKE